MAEGVNLGSWSQLTRWRAECYERFGSIRDLPVCVPHEEIRRLLGPDSRVLDVGAGVPESLQAIVSLPAQCYYSLDNDPAGDFDFRLMGEVPADLEFDLAVANQVIEHLNLVDSWSLISMVYRHLACGGYFLAAVPNAARPVRQWGDAAHVTAWPIGDL